MGYEFMKSRPSLIGATHYDRTTGQHVALTTLVTVTDGDNCWTLRPSEFEAMYAPIPEGQMPAADSAWRGMNTFLNSLKALAS
jgi:hypothetical protein